MASLARAPAGPSTHVPCLTSAPRVAFPAPFTPSGGVPQRAPGCNFPRSYQDVALFLFAEQKENNIKWRRRRKKIGVRCKNLAFYTTESLNEPFFAEQKRKNGAAGKKNLGTACMVRDFMVRSATQFPKKCKKLFLQICKIFFFFSKLRFGPGEFKSLDFFQKNRFEVKNRFGQKKANSELSRPPTGLTPHPSSLNNFFFFFFFFFLRLPTL